MLLSFLFPREIVWQIDSACKSRIKYWSYSELWTLWCVRMPVCNSTEIGSNWTLTDDVDDLISMMSIYKLLQSELTSKSLESEVKIQIVQQYESSCLKNFNVRSNSPRRHVVCFSQTINTYRHWNYCFPCLWWHREYKLVNTSSRVLSSSISSGNGVDRFLNVLFENSTSTSTWWTQ